MRAALNLPDNSAKGEAEFEMSAQDFQRVAALTEQVAGIILKEHKQQMVYARLSRRLRALNFTSFSAYLDFLQGPGGKGEMEKFITRSRPI